MKKLASIIITVLVLSLFVLPYGYAKASEAEKYKSIAEVPAIFKAESIGRPLKEQYIKHLLSIIHLHANGSNGLTEESLKKYQENEIFRKRVSQRERILKYDLNFDSKVTYDEIANPFAFLLKNQDTEETRERRIKQLMQYDINNDKVLSYAEISSPSPKETKAIQYGYIVTKGRDLLELDPNKDGTITVNELTNMAKSAFQLFDQDGNGKISSREYKEMWKNNK